MPELPDVETFRRYLNRTALHKKISDVEISRARILKGISQKKLKKELSGRSMESTDRHGKWMFANLDDGRILVLHFGMTGFLKYFKNPEGDTEHDRMLLSFKNGYHLAYDSQRLLGEVRLIDDAGKFVSDHDLGPDALDGISDFGTFREILENTRGMAKSALMNQGNVAGIGNVYSDEILFQARIHPKAEISKLDESSMKKLYRAMKRVLKKAIEKKVDPDDFPTSWLIPYRNEGKKCPGKCKGEVKKISVSGRNGYYCPGCQKK